MWNDAWNFASGDLYQIHTLQRYYNHFLVMLDTFNEYHCSFLECSVLISYKTITVGHTVCPTDLQIYFEFSWENLVQKSLISPPLPCKSMLLP